MSWIRLVSSALVFSGFFLYGRLNAAKSSDRIDCIGGLLKELEITECRLELLRRPLEELALEAAGHGVNTVFWQAIANELGNGSDPYEAYIKAESSIRADEAKPILKELFDKLGSSDAETEIKRLKTAERELSAVYKELKERYEKNTKLKSSLSVMLGLAAALIVL